MARWFMLGEAAAIGREMLRRDGDETELKIKYFGGFVLFKKNTGYHK